MASRFVIIRGKTIEVSLKFNVASSLNLSEQMKLSLIEILMDLEVIIE